MLCLMLDPPKNTAPCIFVGWAVILGTLFCQLNLKLSDGFNYKMCQMYL